MKYNELILKKNKSKRTVLAAVFQQDKVKQPAVAPKVKVPEKAVVYVPGLKAAKCLFICAYQNFAVLKASARLLKLFIPAN
jgi:hypothetical protein